MLNEILHGLGVALVTPFNKDHSIDYKGLGNLLDHQRNNAHYLVVMGTTGESATLSFEEKMQVLSFVRENARDLPIVYGVGGNNTQNIIKEIKDSRLEGVSAILSVSPYYNKPPQKGIIEHYRKIADNSKLPIILYNVPGRTSSNLSAETTLTLSKEENIIGIKEANTDINQINIISNEKPDDFLLISGDDMNTLSMLAAGGHGLISVLGNAFPEIFKNSIESFWNGNIENARKELFRLNRLNRLMYVESNPVGIKQVLEEKGICNSFVRLPLLKASSSLKTVIKEELQQV